MKIIPNRLKVVFPKINGLEQVSFIVGRNITDNIIVVEVVIHFMAIRIKVCLIHFENVFRISWCLFSKMG